MRCDRCGKDFATGLSQCPYCQAPVHYGGNTVFFGQALRSELNIRDFFSNIFGSHPPGAGDKMFASGTALTTPTPDRMLSDWVKPWLYARIIIIGLLFDFLCYFLFRQQMQPGGMFLLFSVGSLVFPLAILVFYWEINVPRNIPIYRVMLIFFIGGMLSLIFTLLLPQGSAPYFAPLTEEPGKILAMAVFIYMLDSKKIFNGLLIGAAVGAGFAAFEDVYYVCSKSMDFMIAHIMEILVNNPNILPAIYKGMVVYVTGQPVPLSEEEAVLLQSFVQDYRNAMYTQGMDILILRSLHSLGGHVTWAAIEGGALVMVKGNETLQTKHFFESRFLAYVAITVVLHGIWNTGISLYPLPYVNNLTYVLLSLAAVYTAFTLIQKAVNQTLADADIAMRSPSFGSGAATFAPVAVLKGIAGPLSSAVFSLGQRLTIGRDPAACNVLFPPNTKGVSRRHCTVENRADGVYLMDLGSSAGTFFNGNQRAPINQWVRLSGDFALGSPQISFAVDAGNGLPPQPVQNFTPPVPAATGTLSLAAVAGPLAGQKFSLGQRLTIGRDPSSCNVVLPSDTKGVSRRHCTVEKRADGVYLTDIGSSTGTFLASGQRLAANQPMKINGSFYLGSPAVMFSIE